MRRTRKRELALGAGQRWLLHRISDLMYEANATTVLDLPSMEQVRDRTADHIAANPEDFPGPNAFDRAMGTLTDASLISRLSDTAFVEDETDKVVILPQGLDMLARDLPPSQIHSLVDPASQISLGVAAGTAIEMIMTGETGLLIMAAGGTTLAGALRARINRNSRKCVADEQARYRDLLGDGLPNVRELEGSPQYGEYRLRARNGLTSNARAVLTSLYELRAEHQSIDSGLIIHNMKARRAALDYDPKAAPWELHFGVAELEQIGAVVANRSREGAIQDVALTAAGLGLAEGTLGNKNGRLQSDTRDTL